MEEKMANKKKSLKEIDNADLNNHAFASFTSPNMHMQQSLNQKPNLENEKSSIHYRKSDVALSLVRKKEDDFFADFDTYNKKNSIGEEPKIQATDLHQGNLFFGFNFNHDNKRNINKFFFVINKIF